MIKSKTSKISVIIPNYNNSSWLLKTIESCVSQKGNFIIEIIIVDDQSTDNSWELLAEYKTKYPEIQVYKNPSKGANSARVLGFEKSTGNYIQWLDSDDQLLPNKFEKQLSCFNQNNLIDVVYSDFRMDFYEKNVLKSTTNNFYKPTSDYLEDLLNNKWNAVHSYLFKRDLVKKTININGWNSKTNVGQDREFVTKAAILGGKFHYCKGLFAVYNRWSKTSISHVSHLNNIENSSILNQKFYVLLNQNKLSKKKDYIKILNTELIRNLYYHPKLVLPRTIKYKMINWKNIHWKIRPLVFFKYLFK